MPATPYSPGRLTLPSVQLTDQQFVYTKASHTDITHTIRRAREVLAQRQRQAALREAAAQPQLPGITPMQQPVQRVRAGIAGVIHLPTL